ncbi:hypothetical protein FRC12_002629 [Ceratobasidium sp. 428]|nr:hypothetical protein FRC12_002629 [Ceratobasidium sp. 428]
MEVADSHMLEHPSTFTPSSHADIDMSGDYYDEEYMMHDAHSTAEVVADDGMYDAEIEEQTGQTEVEMDEYTDELVDNIETNMGTYTNDAVVTDMTVEDVHLPSSPVVSATPRGLSPQPVAAQSISPHVAEDDGLIINEAAPANPLSDHSPQSATTLIGEPENISPESENRELDHGLHEVIDLTSGGAENPALTDDSTATHEGAQTELAREEIYEEQDPLTATTSPIIQPSAADQPYQEQEEEDYVDSLAPNGASGSLATTLRDSEAAEPYDDRAGDEAHSPIEEALVLNQQARDDAADTMEPSPPVRLSYDNDSSGTVQIFDLFAPIEASPKSLDVLFEDNRTLFYDPLSVFFAKLRETKYFSDVAWQDAEMGLTVDLGSHKLSITEASYIRE